MTKGHLDQTRTGQRSTKHQSRPVPTEPSDNNQRTNEQPHDFCIPVSKQEERCNLVYATCSTITGQVFTDQTGKFVVPSTAGHNYVMILYDYDGNSIQSEPMKSRTAQEHVRAYQTVHTKLVKQGLRQKL